MIKKLQDLYLVVKVGKQNLTAKMSFRRISIFFSQFRRCKRCKEKRRFSKCFRVLFWSKLRLFCCSNCACGLHRGLKTQKQLIRTALLDWLKRTFCRNDWARLDSEPKKPLLPLTNEPPSFCLLSSCSFQHKNRLLRTCFVTFCGKYVALPRYGYK